MKIKRALTVILLSICSVLFISTSSATAGECSVDDPCNTYAVVDNYGKIINIIICQPSVCGSGIWSGQKVVPQVAAESNGQNRGGYWGTESNGVFTIQNGGETNTITQTINNNEVTVEMNSPLKQTSTFNDTINKPVEQWFTPVQISNDTKVTISVNDEEMSFNERMTENDFNYEVWLSEFELLLQNLNFFDFILFGWGWFI